MPTHLEEERHDGEGEDDGGDDGDVLGGLSAGVAAGSLLAVVEDSQADANRSDNEAGNEGEGAQERDDEVEHQESGVAPVGANETCIHDEPARSKDDVRNAQLKVEKENKSTS